jgi:hypothetical protein
MILALYRVRGLIYLVAGAVLIANVVLGSLMEDAWARPAVRWPFALWLRCWAVWCWSVSAPDSFPNERSRWSPPRCGVDGWR